MVTTGGLFVGTNHLLGHLEARSNINMSWLRRLNNDDRTHDTYVDTDYMLASNFKRRLAFRFHAGWVYAHQ
jgi:hypothetical protein